MSESLKFSARAQTATNFWLHCAPKMSSSGVCNFGTIWLSLVSCDFEQKCGSHLGVFQILTRANPQILSARALGARREQTTTCFWLGCAPKMSISRVRDFAAIWLFCVSCASRTYLGVILKSFARAFGTRRPQLAFGWGALQNEQFSSGRFCRDLPLVCLLCFREHVGGLSGILSSTLLLFRKDQV